MADNDIATKAPENDAVQQSIFPGDTPAQEGASMGVKTTVQSELSDIG